MFYLSRVCHVSPSSGVFIFQLSRVFSFSPFWDVSMFHFSRISFFDFLRCFIFHLFRVFLCCCTSTATNLGEHFLLSGTFFTLHSFLTFGTTCFYQGFPGGSSSSLKIAGPPSEFRNTDPAHLFV